MTAYLCRFPPRSAPFHRADARPVRADQLAELVLSEAEGLKQGPPNDGSVSPFGRPEGGGEDVRVDGCRLINNGGAVRFRLMPGLGPTAEVLPDASRGARPLLWRQKWPKPLTPRLALLRGVTPTLRRANQLAWLRQGPLADQERPSFGPTGRRRIIQDEPIRFIHERAVSAGRTAERRSVPVALFGQATRPGEPREEG